MKKLILYTLVGVAATTVFASETPLCSLPIGNSKVIVDNAKVEGDKDPGCAQVYASAVEMAKNTNFKVSLVNDSATPPQLSVGAVYLQPITMSPDGMMLPRAKSDIHLEIDIHAKENLKSRGFAPGDWLPNVNVNFTIWKIGKNKPLTCGMGKNKNSTTCMLMPMVASDGAHYGDNVKLDGPGFYVVTFDAKTDPMKFGWHTDTDSKVLGTEYVQWKFKQSYVFKYTGIGKKGGY